MTVTIGGIAATVLWSGLIAAGLYQINITVPSAFKLGWAPALITNFQMDSNAPGSASSTIPSRSIGS